MSVIERWTSENKEHHHYAAFAGFEKDIKERSEALAEAYAEMDIYGQIQLFAFVCDLLHEEELDHEQDMIGHAEKT